MAAAVGRRIVLTLVVMVLLLAVVGCGDDDASSTATSVSEVVSPTTSTIPPTMSTIPPTTTTSTTTTSTTVAPLPSYEDIRAAYPPEVELCALTGRVTGTNPDGSLEIEYGRGGELVDDLDPFPCWGMRLATDTPLAYGGTQYDIGAELVVDPNTDPSALQVGAASGNPLVVESQGIGVTVGQIYTTWTPATGVGLVQVAN